MRLFAVFCLCLLYFAQPQMALADDLSELEDLLEDEESGTNEDEGGDESEDEAVAHRIGVTEVGRAVEIRLLRSDAEDRDECQHSCDKDADGELATHEHYASYARPRIRANAKPRTTGHVVPSDSRLC